MSWFFNMCDSNMHGERIKIQKRCLRRSEDNICFKIFLTAIPLYLTEFINLQNIISFAEIYFT
jgi:hypothetical protein